MFNQSLTWYLFNFQTVKQTMEAHTQSVEDNLIDSLSFKLRAGASYVPDRRSVSFSFHLAATITQATALESLKSV